jgi:hypothetical protein
MLRIGSVGVYASTEGMPLGIQFARSRGVSFTAT